VTFIRRFVGHLLSGALVILPAVVTLWVIGAVTKWVGHRFGPDSLIGRALTARSESRIEDWLILFVVYSAFVVLIALLGWYTKRRARNVVTESARSLFGRFPIVNRIYAAVEQVATVVRQQPTEGGGLTKFGDVAIARFANLHIIGVLTSRKVYRFGETDYVQLFLPHAPVPATGFLYLVPIEDVYLSDVSIEEFTKIIVSIGSLTSQVFDRTDHRVRRVHLKQDPETLKHRLMPEEGDWPGPGESSS
jgi:uncharacterized membrane protein